MGFATPVSLRRYQKRDPSDALVVMRFGKEPIILAHHEVKVLQSSPFWVGHLLDLVDPIPTLLQVLDSSMSKVKKHHIMG
jgi:hypothetical protein